MEALGDYLLDYYRRLIEKAGMSGKATVGDLPFRWQTDFHFPWSGGWLGNQEGTLEERDLVVVIPGRDRRRAVIMADHYDTAYMEDRYEKPRGGNGARLAAAGADDNHSATAALMLGGPIFLELSRAGLLGVRRVAGPSDRRGVPLRLHGRPAPGPGASWKARSSSAAGAAASSISPRSRSRASTCST